MPIMRNKIFVIGAMLLSALSGCDPEHRCHVPIGNANCRIEPNSPLYYELNHTGGYEYLNGGAHGLVVVRTSLNEFAVYERTCPVDHDTIVYADDDWGGAIMTCPKCQTHFSTYTDGYPLEGGATECPLFQYTSSYDGVYLYIN